MNIAVLLTKKHKSQVAGRRPSTRSGIFIASQRPRSSSRQQAWVQVKAVDWLDRRRHSHACIWYQVHYTLCL